MERYAQQSQCDLFSAEPIEVLFILEGSRGISLVGEI